MKIAMIHTPLVSRGGGQRQILKLAFEMQKFGHEVEIFTSAVNKEKCYREIIEKLTVTVIPHPFGKKIPKFLIPSEINHAVFLLMTTTHIPHRATALGITSTCTLLGFQEAFFRSITGDFRISITNSPARSCCNRFVFF